MSSSTTGETRDRRASCCPASQLGSANAIAAAHRFLQIDWCTTALHKASITRKRSSAAQYVYNTKAK